MAALAPSVAAIRAAVRRTLHHAAPLEPAAPPAQAGPPLLLVACSGGPDSLALAAAAGFVAPRLGWRAGLVTVDHGLQPGSARVAEQVATWAAKASLDPVEVVPVSVAGRLGGPEAAARSARYEALAGAARRLGAAATGAGAAGGAIGADGAGRGSAAAVVLLGHTRDDQAETVLLALARGAGPHGLAGMPARRDRDGVTWLRPLLDITRAQARDACTALGLEPWHDPHNTDPSYARSRVRASVLPALVEALGERVVDNLARTARQVADDTAVLDGLAAGALATARAPDGALVAATLRELPAAIRTRVLHAWARQLGAPGSALSHRHVTALDALVTDWRGQGPTYLPGGITVTRHAGRLLAQDLPSFGV